MSTTRLGSPQRPSNSRNSVKRTYSECFDELSERGCETILVVVGDASFTVNKRLLADHSPYFQAMFFSSNMCEATADQVVLQEVQSEVFEILLDFVKDGYLTLTSENVQDVLEAACMFQFQQVTDICYNYLVENLTLSTCLHMWWLAETYSITSDNNLYKHSKYMAVTNFSEVLSQLSIQDLPFNLLKQYLGEESLVADENMVLSVILKWIEGFANYKNELKEKAKLYDQCSTLLNACVDWLRFSSDELQKILKSNLVENFPDLRENLLSIARISNQFCFACRASLALKRNDRTCLRSSECKLNTNFWSNFADRRLRSSSEIPGFVVRNESVSAWTSKYSIICYKDEKFVSIAPVPRSIKFSELVGYRICSVGRYVFIIGGERFRIGSGIWNSDVWRLDTFSKKWEVVCQLSHVRRNYMICTIQDCIYLIGGYGPYRIRLQSMSRLNCKTWQWTHWNFAEDNKDSCQTIHSVNTKTVVIRKKIYLIECVVKGTVVHCFDTETEKWNDPFDGLHISLPVYDYNDWLLSACKWALTLTDPLSHQTVQFKWPEIKKTSCFYSQLCGKSLLMFNVDQEKSVIFRDISSCEICHKDIECNYQFEIGFSLNLYD